MYRFEWLIHPITCTTGAVLAEREPVHRLVNSSLADSRMATLTGTFVGKITVDQDGNLGHLIKVRMVADPQVSPP